MGIFKLLSKPEYNKENKREYIKTRKQGYFEL